MNHQFLSALFLILSVFLFESSAQTVRYYTAEAAYDKNGIKHSPNGWPEIYLAFVQNNNLIYMCDKNGNPASGPYEWRYKTTQNNIRIYQAVQYQLWSFYPFPWLYITSDFSRANLVRWEKIGGYFPDTNSTDPGWTYVFNLSNPSKIESPSVFY